MPRKKRSASPFSLAFLDIMSCGFGAVVLLFLIIKHNADTFVENPVPEIDVDDELALLAEDITSQRNLLEALNEKLGDMGRTLAAAAGERDSRKSDLEQAQGELKGMDANDQNRNVDMLKASIKEMEQQNARIEAELKQQAEQEARDLLAVKGDGDREYLTGLKVGGRRILLLVDTSASMLDESIVNIIRTRNMSPQMQRQARKWRQTLASVEWLLARMPPLGQYQIYTFSTSVEPALPGTLGRWLDRADNDKLKQAVANVGERLPLGGTNLHNVMESVRGLNPPPDNIYLVTDGLPTLGPSPPRGATIDGRARKRLFDRAVDQLPRGIPVNVILLPLEGDPLAAWSFWGLAVRSNGAMIAPARDWP